MSDYKPLKEVLIESLKIAQSKPYTDFAEDGDDSYGFGVKIGLICALTNIIEILEDT